MAKTPHNRKIWSLSNYPLTRIILPYVMGLLLANAFQIPYSGIISLLIIIILLVLYQFVSNLFFHVILVVCSFTLGYHWVKLRPSITKPQHYTQFISDSSKSVITVLLLSDGEEKERSILYEGEIIGIRNVNTKDWNAVQGKIPLYLLQSTDEAALSLAYGDTLIFTSRLNPFTRPISTYHFNYEKYMFNRGYYHQVFIRSDDILYHGQSTIQTPIILKWRKQIQNILNQSIQNPTTHSLMSAVLLNDKANMNPELRTHFSKTGISHIIAISGMHVAIVCSFLLFFIPFIKHTKVKVVLFLLSIIIVWLYIAITKYPPSAIRAASMFTLGVIGVFLKREVYSINNLIITALIMLIYQPLWIWDVGFQLSFIAVLSILLFNPAIQRLWQPNHRILHYFWSIVSISLSVQILVFPLILYYFNSFPLLVLLANIPAVMYSFVLLSGSFILLIVYFIHPQLGVWVGQLLSFITEYFYLSIQLLSEITPTFFQTFYISKQGLLLIYVLIALFLLSVYQKHLKYWLISTVFTLLFIGFQIKEFYNKSNENFVLIFHQRQETFVFIKQHQQGYFIHPPDLDEKIYQYNVLPLEIAYQIKQVDRFEWMDWQKLSLSQIEINNGWSLKNEDVHTLNLIGRNNIETEVIKNSNKRWVQIIVLPDVPFYYLDSIKENYATISDSIHILREQPYFAFIQPPQ